MLLFEATVIKIVSIRHYLLPKANVAVSMQAQVTHGVLKEYFSDTLSWGTTRNSQKSLQVPVEMA